MSLLVLDTHVWLWWEANPERLSPAAAAVIDGAEALGVCAISCWELAMLVERGRITLDRPTDRWIRHALSRGRVESLSLSSEAALAAASLPQGSFPADPADRLIYSSARSLGARLVTRDAALRRFDPAFTVW